MTITLRSIVLVFSLMLAATVAAHQQKESITRVLFNARTGNIEVMHRFLLHDVEHASRQLFGKTADLLSNTQDRDQFQKYVHGRFALKDQDGAVIALTPIGNEIEGRFLWVYAEAPTPAKLSALTISHASLHDVWSEQSNLVNVEYNGDVRSAVFRGGHGAHTIEF
ncbi:MAG: DUF6702 family protein [Gammaproteobacteria bacterium]